MPLLQNKFFDLSTFYCRKFALKLFQHSPIYFFNILAYQSKYQRHLLSPKSEKKVKHALLREKNHYFELSANWLALRKLAQSKR